MNRAPRERQDLKFGTKMDPDKMLPGNPTPPHITEHSRAMTAAPRHDLDSSMESIGSPLHQEPCQEPTPVKPREPLEEETPALASSASSDAAEENTPEHVETKHTSSVKCTINVPLRAEMELGAVFRTDHDVVQVRQCPPESEVSAHCTVPEPTTCIPSTFPNPSLKTN